jgi:hypothetical protein
MWPGDGGLVAHGVRAMRNYYTAQWLRERVGDRRYLKFESIIFLTMTFVQLNSTIICYTLCREMGYPKSGGMGAPYLSES